MSTKPECCVFNKPIDCNDHKCDNCGWNPEVAAKRIAKWKKNVTKKNENN